MSGGGQRSDDRRAARRAWVSGVVVWALVFQLLLPLVGPLRHGESAGIAVAGRIVPICAIDGVRLIDLARSDSESGSAAILPDGGWHCVLCALPATLATTVEVPVGPVEWRVAHVLPPPTAPPPGRPPSPLSARGPPLLS